MKEHCEHLKCDKDHRNFDKCGVKDGTDDYLFQMRQSVENTFK